MDQAACCLVILAIVLLALLFGWGLMRNKDCNCENYMNSDLAPRYNGDCLFNRDMVDYYPSDEINPFAITGEGNKYMPLESRYEHDLYAEQRKLACPGRMNMQYEPCWGAKSHRVRSNDRQTRSEMTRLGHDLARVEEMKRMAVNKSYY